MTERPTEGATKLHDYEAFVAVVDAGNLTRAAARLRRSLQSVSRSLAALESQLGVVLVRRTTRQAQPTEAGLAFHRRLTTALREITLAETELRNTSGALSGTLRVASSSLFAARFLVPAIREFSAQHPSVHFDLHASERFTEPIHTGADLMIRIGDLQASALKARKLALMRRVVVASPAYLAQRGRPERPSDLGGHACLVRTSSQHARTWSFLGPDGAREQVTIEGTFAADDAHVVNQAAIAGLGIAATHFWLVRDAIEAGAVEVLLEEFSLPPLPVHALWPAAPRVPARVKRFVDLLAQRLTKEIF